MKLVFTSMHRKHIQKQHLFNEKMIEGSSGYGWGWLDQSREIDKLWDLSSEARWKRLVQFYDQN